MFGMGLRRLISYLGPRASASIAAGVLVLTLGHQLPFNDVQGYKFSVQALAGFLIAVGVAKGLLHVFFPHSEEKIWEGIQAGVTAGFAAGIVGGWIGYASDHFYDPWQMSFTSRLFVVLAAATPVGGLVGAACAMAANREHDRKLEFSTLGSSLILMATMAGVLLSVDLPDAKDKPGFQFWHLLVVFEAFLGAYLLIEAREQKWRLFRIPIALVLAACCGVLGTIASNHRVVQYGVATTLSHMEFDYDDEDGSKRLVLSIVGLIFGTVLAYVLAMKGSLRVYDAFEHWLKQRHGRSDLSTANKDKT